MIIKVFPYLSSEIEVATIETQQDMKDIILNTDMFIIQQYDKYVCISRYVSNTILSSYVKGKLIDCIPF